jgi:hypothetical protein
MSRLAVRIFVDVLLVVVPLIVFLVLYIVEPTFERGFYCDDESLHYPYKVDSRIRSVWELQSCSCPISKFFFGRYLFAHPPWILAGHGVATHRVLIDQIDVSTFSFLSLMRLILNHLHWP